jgi:hypothetical protein
MDAAKAAIEPFGWRGLRYHNINPKVTGGLLLPAPSMN